MGDSGSFDYLSVAVGGQQSAISSQQSAISLIEPRALREEADEKRLILNAESQRLRALGFQPSDLSFMSRMAPQKLFPTLRER